MKCTPGEMCIFCPLYLFCGKHDWEDKEGIANDPE